jgi:hypothetical protein
MRKPTILGGLERVFISYRREDSKFALSLRQALRAENVTVWWDEELRAGENWDAEIDKALLEAEVVVVLWSQSSVSSEWVRYEAAVGKIQAKLAHARIAEVTVPAPFQSIQMEDLSAWDGREDHTEFQKLLKAIRALHNRHRRARTWRALKVAAAALASIMIGFIFSIRIDGSFLNRNMTAQTSLTQDVPLELTIFDRQASKSIERVIIPTFTSTVVNYGGATDGDYLDGLADLLVGRLAPVFPTAFVKLDPERPPGIENTLKYIPTASFPSNRVGVILGRVLKYQDERPDIGQKAIVSVVVTLFTHDKKQLLTVSSTVSASTPQPSGNPPTNGVEAIELIDHIFSRIKERLQTELSQPGI